MLALTRKQGERILIGDNIIIEIVETKFDRVRIGIIAPKEMLILREELEGRIREEGVKTLNVGTSPVQAE